MSDHIAGGGKMILNNEPRAIDIQIAWTRAVQCSQIIGAGAESRAELQRLRDAKRTWIGREQNALRYAVDCWLRETDAALTDRGEA